jgi:predicted ArsR family transcriptional regulator
MKSSAKTGNPMRKMERLVRGFSNHRRIEIIHLLSQQPELSVIEIASELRINFKTASEHIRRLAIAGIIVKRNEGSAVRHALTDTGRTILKFLRTLE